MKRFYHLFERGCVARKWIPPTLITLFAACGTPRSYFPASATLWIFRCRIFFCTRLSPSPRYASNHSYCFPCKDWNLCFDLRLVCCHHCWADVSFWFFHSKLVRYRSDSNSRLAYPVAIYPPLQQPSSVDWNLVVAQLFHLLFHLLYCMKDGLSAQLWPSPAQHRYQPIPRQVICPTLLLSRLLGRHWNFGFYSINASYLAWVLRNHFRSFWRVSCFAKLLFHFWWQRYKTWYDHVHQHASKTSQTYAVWRSRCCCNKSLAFSSYLRNYVDRPVRRKSFPLWWTLHHC